MASFKIGCDDEIVVVAPEKGRSFCLTNSRHIFLGLLVELRQAILAAELNCLAVVHESIRFVSQILIGNDTLGQRVGRTGNGS